MDEVHSLKIYEKANMPLKVPDFRWVSLSRENRRHLVKAIGWTAKTSDHIVRTDVGVYIYLGEADLKYPNEVNVC